MDTMSRIAALVSDCAASLWPDAQGLPAAEELRGLLARASAGKEESDKEETP